MGSNLRKVRRDSKENMELICRIIFTLIGLLKLDNENLNISEERSRRNASLGPPVMSSIRDEENSISASTSEYINDGNNNIWKKSGSQMVCFDYF